MRNLRGNGTRKHMGSSHVGADRPVLRAEKCAYIKKSIPLLGGSMGGGDRVP